MPMQRTTNCWRMTITPTAYVIQIRLAAHVTESRPTVFTLRNLMVKWLVYWTEVTAAWPRLLCRCLRSNKNTEWELMVKWSEGSARSKRSRWPGRQTTKFSVHQHRPRNAKLSSQVKEGRTVETEFRNRIMTVYSESSSVVWARGDVKRCISTRHTQENTVLPLILQTALPIFSPSFFFTLHKNNNLLYELYQYS